MNTDQAGNSQKNTDICDIKLKGFELILPNSNEVLTNTKCFDFVKLCRKEFSVGLQGKNFQANELSEIRKFKKINVCSL